MCNKMKFTKAFPLVDLISFRGGSNPGAAGAHFRVYAGHFWLLVDLPGSVRSAGRGRMLLR